MTDTFTMTQGPPEEYDLLGRFVRGNLVTAEEIGREPTTADRLTALSDLLNDATKMLSELSWKVRLETMDPEVGPRPAGAVEAWRACPVARRPGADALPLLVRRGGPSVRAERHFPRRRKQHDQPRGSSCAVVDHRRYLCLPRRRHRVGLCRGSRPDAG